MAPGCDKKTCRALKNDRSPVSSHVQLHVQLRYLAVQNICTLIVQAKFACGDDDPTERIPREVGILSGCSRAVRVSEDIEQHVSHCIDRCSHQLPLRVVAGIRRGDRRWSAARPHRHFGQWGACGFAARCCRRWAARSPRVGFLDIPRTGKREVHRRRNKHTIYLKNAFQVTPWTKYFGTERARLCLFLKIRCDHGRLRGAIRAPSFANALCLTGF